MVDVDGLVAPQIDRQPVQTDDPVAGEMLLDVGRLAFKPGKRVAMIDPRIELPHDRAGGHGLGGKHTETLNGAGKHTNGDQQHAARCEGQRSARSARTTSGPGYAVNPFGHWAAATFARFSVGSAACGY